MIDDVTDMANIQELSAAGCHQECLQACENALQANQEEDCAYKYAGKSLLALGQFKKAQQYLIKAHQLDSSDPETAKDIGDIFLNLGNKKTALEWYEKALEINNQYATAFNNIANIKRQLGNNREAINLFKKAIQADPTLIQAYVGAAASFLALGDLDQATSFANQALAINETTAGANGILGIIFQNQNNPEQAIECYQKESEANPQARNSLLNLGLLLLQKGQTSAAVASLVKASALAPSEQCSLLLAQAYQNLGQFREANIEYKKISIDQSKNKLIPFNFGLCLLNDGNNIDAIKAFKLAIEIDNKFMAAWGNLGNALMNEGKHHEALPATLKALELKPDNPIIHINLGVIYQNLGQLDQALASTLKVLELKPDNPTAHINLGGIYKDLGRLDQALVSTLKAIELKPDNPTVHINLGGIYQSLGRLDQALASTLKALELKPDNPIIHINLGQIYQNLGQLDQALASTLKALEHESDNHTANMNLGEIYKDLGRLDQALASTLKALELKPDNPTAHFNLGGIYQDLGQFDQALICLKEAIKSEKTNEKAAIQLAQTYYYMGNYRDGVQAISDIHNKVAGNLLLSLYLCLNEELEFKRCADDLIGKQWLNPQGVAAIDHANILYNQTLDNGLDGTTMDSILVQHINKQEFSDALIQEILIRLSSGLLQPRSQGLLANGSQTSGNILDIPEKPFQSLKELLIQKIESYNKVCNINTDKNFRVNWEKNLYQLRGWAIIIEKGGNLNSHNHELGWLTGTFYLQMPERGLNAEEGAIEFSHQGPKYPESSSIFERKVIRPNARDLNIFSSSLFHRTLPFQTETQRICVAFDVTRNEKLWKASNKNLN